MLSDEERQAIKFLEKLKDLKIILSCSFWNNGEFEFNNIQKEQFDIILGLIDKQSKEIEELKEQCKEVVCIPEGTCFMLEPKDVNKKWEDKINAKIEEWDNKDLTICYGGRSQGRTFQQAVRNEVKKILQSLLEKE